MINPVLVVDSFEGQGMLDLDALYDNGIRHLLIRLGCYNAFGLLGNRKDKLFDAQWLAIALDARFKVGVYIPYNPWRTWQYNLQWLLDNLPSECETVEIDIENYRPYSPKTYGAEVSEYIKHIPEYIEVIQYTGEGFLSYLSPWPEIPFSWAQYPSNLRPSDTLKLNWDQLRKMLKNYTSPFNSSRCPGKIVMWQFTGDKLVLPGSNKGLDVYVWLGTKDELDRFFSSKTIVPPPPPEQPVSKYTGKVKEAVTLGAKVRVTPISGEQIGSLRVKEEFEGDEMETTLSGDWIHITKPLVGWVAAWLTDYKDNYPPTFESKPAIPGPFRIMGKREAGDEYGAGQPGHLDAYPATMQTRGSIKGNLLLPRLWLGILKLLTKFYDALWKEDEGWSNNGQEGRVQPVLFSGDPEKDNNLVWVTGISGDGFYEVDSWHTTDTPSISDVRKDAYRLGTITVDYVSGGVKNSDRLLPYLNITKDKTEVYRLDPRYLESKFSVPSKVIVRTNGDNLNVHSSASLESSVLTTLKSGQEITIFKLSKSGPNIFGLATQPGSIEGWIAMWLTSWRE